MAMTAERAAGHMHPKPIRRSQEFGLAAYTWVQITHAPKLVPPTSRSTCHAV
jgi:hypothetical protein